MSKVTLAQMSELCSQADSGRVTREALQLFLENPSIVFQSQKDEVKPPSLMDLVTYSISEGILTMNIPQGLTVNDVIEGCKKEFKVYVYTDRDLNEYVTHDRDPRNGAYTISFKYVVEADEEHKNKSANDLKKDGGVYVTLLERLVMEWIYFKETGKHLDIDNVTLCAGSRDEDGDVPGVCWFSGRDELRVYCCKPDDRSDELRTRQAVSDNT